MKFSIPQVDCRVEWKIPSFIHTYFKLQIYLHEFSLAASSQANRGG